MKKNTNVIISSVSLIVSVLLLVNTFSLSSQIKSLKNSIENTNNSLYSQYSNISSNIYNISGSVTAAVEKGTSIIASSEYNFGEINKTDFSIPVIFSITPKEYSEGTVAQIYINNKPYDMIYNNGHFEYTADTKLNSDSLEATKVALISKGTTKFQELSDMYVSVKNEFFPYIDCDFSSTSNYTTTNNNTLSFNCSGDVNLNISYLGYADSNKDKIKSAKANLYVNDELEKSFNINIDDESYGYINISDCRLEIPSDSEFYIEAEITNDKGFAYKKVIYSFETDSKGNMVNEITFYGGDTESSEELSGFKVYDSNGKYLCTL